MAKNLILAISFGFKLNSNLKYPTTLLCFISDEENVMVQMEGTVPSDGSSVHMSVLSGGRTLDIYKCTDFNCSFGCLNSSKRYHCPLCDNKPQKPGRMRRHFIKMHSGKQLVQHEGDEEGCCLPPISRDSALPFSDEYLFGSSFTKISFFKPSKIG